MQHDPDTANPSAAVAVMSRRRRIERTDITWAPYGTRRACTRAALLDPLHRWSPAARHRVVLDVEPAAAPISVLALILAVIALTPQHTYEVAPSSWSRVRAGLTEHALLAATYDALWMLRHEPSIHWSQQQMAVLDWPAARLIWPLSNLHLVELEARAAA